MASSKSGAHSLFFSDAASRTANTSDDDEVRQISSFIRSGKRKAAPSNVTPSTVLKAKEMAKVGKQRQTKLNAARDKEARARTNQYVARFFYQAGVPFNAVRLESFKLMIKAIGDYGPHLKPPTARELRVLFLKFEMEEKGKRKKTTSRPSSFRLWINEDEEEEEEEEQIDDIKTQEEEADESSGDEGNDEEENLEELDDDFD